MAAMSPALTLGKCRWPSGARSIAALGPGSGWAARVTPWSGYRAPRNGGLARAASLCVRRRRHMSRPARPNGTGARG